MLQKLPSKLGILNDAPSKVSVQLVSPKDFERPLRVPALHWQTAVTSGGTQRSLAADKAEKNQKSLRKIGFSQNRISQFQSPSTLNAPPNKVSSPELEPAQLAAESASALSEVFSPCRQLNLPRSWLNAPGLFPRLYEIQFSFPVNSGVSVFNLVSLRPEAVAMKYADEVISRLFESCVNNLGEDTIQNMKLHFHKLQNVTDGVFSFKIEFRTALSTGNEKKGI